MKEALIPKLIEKATIKMSPDIKGIWICSLQVSKNQGHRVSHKTIKNKFMVLFLITGLLQT